MGRPSLTGNRALRRGLRTERRRNMRRAGANHRMDAGARDGEGSGCGRVGGQAQSCSLYNAGVAQRPITTAEDQSATFIELFFDLVFVYAVTQTVSLIHEDLSWVGVWHAVVVFWLVWWAWTQYTWALNSADATHPAVEAVMLVATAIAFLMAVTVPDAFGDAGGWFALLSAGGLAAVAGGGVVGG